MAIDVCFYVNSKEHFPQEKGVLAVFSGNLYHLFDHFCVRLFRVPEFLSVWNICFITFLAVAFGALRGDVISLSLSQQGDLHCDPIVISIFI